LELKKEEEELLDEEKDMKMMADVAEVGGKHLKLAEADVFLIFVKVRSFVTSDE
jgi:hypothetical protein